MGLWDREKIDADALFEQGEQYYDQEEYDKALECYETAANHGVADAMYSLGFCYAYGKGVQQDYNAALYWFHEAVDNGSTKAMYQLGRMYEEGMGVDLDYVQATEYYRKAAHLGHIDAQLMLGNCYATGAGVTPDYDRAISYWTMAADQGSKQAQHNIEWVGYINNEELDAAKSLIYGTDGIDQDISFGLDIVNKGIRLGDSAAVYFMGKLLITGIPGYIEPDITTGLDNIIDAAHQGEVGAVYDFISIWKTQSLDGVTVEVSDAFFGKHMVSIAEKIEETEYGLNWAYAYAAWAYAYGNGVAESESIAQQWVTRLPKEMKDGEFIKSLPINGNKGKPQNEQLPKIHKNDSASQNQALTEDELIKKAEAGDVDSMLELANRFYNPQSYTDLERSVMWDTKAAEAGNEDGMLRIAGANHLLAVMNRIESIQNWEASAQFEEAAIKWAKRIEQCDRLVGDQQAIISQTISDATYGLGYSFYRMKQYDQSLQALHNLQEPRAHILQGVIYYSKESTQDNLRRAYYSLTAIETNSDYLITQKSEEEELIYTMGTCFLSTFYRCGLDGVVTTDINRAVMLLQRTEKTLQLTNAKEFISKEIKKYAKKLFGGYKYIEQ